MNLSRYRKHDWFITIIVFVLLIIGGIVIYSATYNTDLVYQGAGSLQKQLLFVILGLGIYFGLNLLDLEWLKQPKILAILYIIVILLLLYLMFFGEDIAQTRRWINLGFINIQPSEYAKILIILISSRILSTTFEFFDSNYLRSPKKKDSLYSKIYDLIERYPMPFLFMTSFVLTIPIIFLVFIQPAFGNSMILFLLWAIITFIAVPSQLKFSLFITNIILTSVFVYGLFSISGYFGLSATIILGLDMIGIVGLILFYIFSVVQIKLDFRVLIVAIILGLTIFPTLKFGWDNILKDYQRERIETYIEGPESDRYGAGYQVTQSKIAVGSGQLYGRGFLEGSQSSLKVLDFAYTDFIFAALSEQFGFVGSSFVLFIYFILLLRIIIIANGTQDTFSTLICVGVATMILLNIFINVGMNLGILPVTGVPLPLISYGGNSILVNLIGLGLVQAVYSQVHSEDISEKILL